jgi:predicted alpha/beta-fold hydrolase
VASDLVSDSYPSFAPRAPWWGADLQTLRNTLAPPAVGELRGVRRVELPLGDPNGDVLLGALQSGAPGRPLVVLVHGLGGSEESVYMQRSAAYFATRGDPVLRLNLRGAGPSLGRCAERYHAGRGEDFAAAMRSLPPELLASGLCVVGFSLGANMLLKLLGEGGHGLAIRAAASVSAPIDLGRSCARIMQRRNALYHAYLLRRLKAESLGMGDALDARERAVAMDAPTLYDFDDRFVAPRNGFAHADDYYTRCSASGFLAAIRVPTLVIHALDDPWIPGALYEEVDWNAHPALEPLLPRRGGHVGFHARDSEAAWHDRCIGHFFDRICGR